MSPTQLVVTTVVVDISFQVPEDQTLPDDLAGMSSYPNLRSLLSFSEPLCFICICVDRLSRLLSASGAQVTVKKIPSPSVAKDSVMYEVVVEGVPKQSKQVNSDSIRIVLEQLTTLDDLVAVGVIVTLKFTFTLGSVWNKVYTHTPVSQTPVSHKPVSNIHTHTHTHTRSSMV